MTRWAMCELDDDGVARLVPIDRWIKVSNRLPKEGTEVLVLADDIGECWFEVAVYDDRMGHFEKSDGRKVAPVTHWMPLPEPPSD